MTKPTDKCAHHNCHRPASAGRDYCGDYCAKDEDDTETWCACQHPECLAQVAGSQG